jgi:hypothetical protein
LSEEILAPGMNDGVRSENCRNHGGFFHGNFALFMHIAAFSSLLLITPTVTL